LLETDLGYGRSFTYQNRTGILIIHELG